MQSTLIDFVRILGTVLWVSILIRALMSWIMPGGGGGLTSVLADITEPILSPIRRVLPPISGIDFSPLLAIILINVVENLLINVLASSG